MIAIVLFFCTILCSIFLQKPRRTVVNRIFIATMMVVSLNSNISATSYYESLSSRIAGIGQAIENVNVPAIGKLANLLPMAALAACFKECPIQTMIVLTALGTYALSYNEAVKEMMDKYEITNNLPWVKRSNNDQQQYIDESIFVFDGDEDDSELSDDDGDDLLGTDLLDDEDDSEKKAKSQRKKQAFLS